MGETETIPKEFYDCSKLFPSKLGQKLSDPETRRWLSKSSVTVAAVGLSSKFWLKCKR
jgi:hypothetical protein